MNTIIKILMQRDQLSYNDARQLVEETQEEIDQAICEGREGEAEEILMDNLGLEMDYLFDLIF